MAKQTKSINMSNANNILKQASFQIMSGICNFQDSMQRINNVAEGKNKKGEEVDIPWQVKLGAMGKYQDYMFQTMDREMNANENMVEDEIAKLSNSELTEHIQALEENSKGKKSTLEVNPDISEEI